jgi:hypothetical protein
MDSLDQALLQLRIVVAGLLAGLLAFAAVALVMGDALARRADPQFAWLLLAVLGLACASTAVGYVVTRRALMRSLGPRAAELRQLADPAPALLDAYRRLTILGAALAEGPGFLALVVYMLTAHPLALAPALASAILVGSQLPSRDGMRRFAEGVLASGP